VISVSSVAKNLRPEFNEADQLATALAEDTETVNTAKAEPLLANDPSPG